MKIIIFFILFTVQAQVDEYSSVTNDFNLITNNDRTSFSELISRFDINQMNISTMMPEVMSSNGIDGYPTGSSLSITDFDVTTVSDETTIIRENQWFTVNQSHARDPYRSVLFWKPTDDPSWKGANYILRSEPRCLRQMCSVKFKYNGTLSNHSGGCLSFSFQTRGQPVGQLWIVEDQDQDNMSQRIQLVNKKLRIEHSLRPKIKNLSIETQILFRNSQIDSLILSNLNVNWKGPCPKHRLVPTPSPDNFGRRATLDEDFFTLTSEGSGFMNTLTTNEEFQSSQQYEISDSTTIVPGRQTTSKRPFSFVNQKNFGWFLSLITLFCVAILLSAVGHSLWLLRRYHHFTWHVTFDSQIQFLARRSIRSSTRSEKKIATVSEIAYDILNSDTQKEQLDISTTISDRSSPMSYYTYL